MSSNLISLSFHSFGLLEVDDSEEEEEEEVDAYVGVLADSSMVSID
jgi:hypothetical protein